VNSWHDDGTLMTFKKEEALEGMRLPEHHPEKFLGATLKIR
jgi:hypothetical protein